MASKPLNSPPKETIRQQQGLSSVWSVEVEQEATAWRYDIDMVCILPGRGGRPTVEKSLAKGADDGLRSLNKDICYELLVATLSQTDTLGLGSQPVDMIYNKSILFSSRPVVPQQVDVDIADSVTLIRDHFGPQARFVVTVRPSKDGQVVRLSNLTQYTSASGGLLLEEDSSLRTFFDLAFSMSVINEGSYTQIGAGKLYRVDPVAIDFGSGIVLRPGLAKGARVVEGAKGRRDARMALVVDAKVSPFFKAQGLHETVREIMLGPRGGQLPPVPNAQWGFATRLVKELRLITTYGGRRRNFIFGSFTDRPIGQITIDVEDRASGTHETVLLPVYFQRKYGVRLAHPDLPGAVPAGPAQHRSIYPLELVEVMADQRVPLEKMESRLSERLHQTNAVRPGERYANTMQHLQSIHAFGGSDVLSAFGIRLLSNSNSVDVGVRAPPQLVFGRGQMARAMPEKANWSRDGSRLPYIQSGEVTQWVVLHSERDATVVCRFAPRLVDSMSRKGMRFGNPVLHQYRGELRDFRSVKSVFENVLSDVPQAEFIIVVSPKTDGSHDFFKYLEARHKRVITQQLSFEKVRDVVEKNQNQTLDNIIHKLNMKTNGLNYYPALAQTSSSSPLDLNNGGIGIIGLDVAHPPPATGRERAEMQKKGVTGVDSLDPSVVGITANMVANPHAFSGDYFCQQSRREAIDTEQLKQRSTWICHQWQLSRMLPHSIVVLRDGVSEGQYKMVLGDEVAAIEAGCRAFDPSYKPKLLVAVATKRHSNRFYQKAQNGGGGQAATVENLQPGSVMQGAGVSRVDTVNFFMQAHLPLKGCGKAVMYTVLRDDIGVSNDQLQAALLSLCYSHQIVFSAVSLPEPIYQADELAKRGSNNYRVMRQYESVPRLANGLPDLRAVNELLSYAGGERTSTRFTA